MARGQKKGPAKRVPRSAGLAICSPRGIGEPHDIAPRGSWHLSCVSICVWWSRPQAASGAASYLGAPGGRRLQPLLEPMIRIWLVVEGLHLAVSTAPVEG